MYRTVFLLAVISMLLFSCKCNENSKQEEVVTPTSTPAAKQDVPTMTNEKIIVKFEKGQSATELQGHINGLYDSKNYVFDVAKAGQMLSAELKPAISPANIRIKQLISPTGVQSGPFDMQMKVELKEAGEWILIVDESMMNGESYVGDYALHISII